MMYKNGPHSTSCTGFAQRWKRPLPHRSSLCTDQTSTQKMESRRFGFISSQMEEMLIPRSALTYIETLEATLAQCSDQYKIATGGGRMHITMDRYEADWDMVKHGYDCHVHAQGERYSSAKEAIEHYYQSDPNIDDQWIPTFVVSDYDGMRDGDAVILFNFRGDRAIENFTCTGRERFFPLRSRSAIQIYIMQV